MATRENNGIILRVLRASLALIFLLQQSLPVSLALPISYEESLQGQQPGIDPFNAPDQDDDTLSQNGFESFLMSAPTLGAPEEGENEDPPMVLFGAPAPQVPGVNVPFVTALPGHPTVNVFNGGGSTVPTLEQNSTTQFKMSGGHVSTTAFVGTSINFENGVGGIQDMSGTDTFSFGIRTDNPCTVNGCVKMEFVDQENDRATLFVSGLSTTWQQVDITQTAILAHNPNVNLERLKYINFVLDANVAPAGSGYIEVETSGLAFDPTLEADPTKQPSDITAVPVLASGSRPAMNTFAGNGATATLDRTSASSALLHYASAAANGFAGAYFDYDDPDTVDKESIDITAVFAGGFVIGLTSPNQTLGTVILEIKDIHGNKDKVKLTGLTDSGQQWFVPLDQFDLLSDSSVDGTQIQVISLVLEGAATDGQAAIDWGNFYFVGDISPDPTQGVGDITKLPVQSNGDRPSLNGFNSSDGTTAHVTMASPTFGTVAYNGTADDSFGGTYISYDDPATVGTVETINLSALYPGGLVIGLDSPDLATVGFEIKDKDGNVSKVNLIDLQNYGQRYLIPLTAFTGVELTQVKEMVLVIKGAGAKTLNVDWGNFVSKLIFPDGTLGIGDVTKLPPLGSGLQPMIQEFASGDGSTSAVLPISSTQATIRYGGVAVDSYGGAYIAYDNPQTPAKESVDLRTLFPGGLVFGLWSADTNEIQFEITDADGNRDVVTLVGVGGAEQFYRVLWDTLGQVDLTRITAMAFLLKGQSYPEVPAGWTRTSGNPDFAYQITSNGNTQTLSFRNLKTGQITNAASLQSSVMNGLNPEFYSFSSINVSADGQAAQFWISGYGVKYSTGQIYRMFTAYARNLAGATNVPVASKMEWDPPQGWPTTNFVGDHILSISPYSGNGYTTQYYNVITGSYVSGPVPPYTPPARTWDVTVDWGDFNTTGVLVPDPTRGVDDITKLPPLTTGVRPALTGFASEDGSASNVTFASHTFAGIYYTGAAADSYGGAFLLYDDLSTAGTVETLNWSAAFPGGMILGLESPNITEAWLEIKDITGNVVLLKVKDLKNYGQRYVVEASDLTGLDLTQIKVITILLKGAGAQTVQVDWGDFYYNPTPEVIGGPYGGFYSTTWLPGHPPVSLIHSENATASLNLAEYFIRLDYNVSADGSYAGAQILFDTPADLLSGGKALVVGGRGSNQDVKLEIETNVGGVIKKDYVILKGVNQVTELNFTMIGSMFEQLNETDLAHVSAIRFIVDNNLAPDQGTLYALVWGADLIHPFGPYSGTTSPTIFDSFRELYSFNSQAPDPESTATVQLLGPARYQLDFNVTNAGSYAGGVSSFDDAETTGTTETHDLSGLYALEIGLKLSSGSGQVKLEIKSGTESDYVILTGVDTTQRFWYVPLLYFENSDLDLSAVTEIVVVVEESGVTDKNANLTVDLGNHELGSFVFPDPGMEPEDITRFPPRADGSLPEFIGFERTVENPTTKLGILPGVGFQLTITDKPGILSYNIFYSDDLQTWKLAEANVPVSGTGKTTWDDDGSLTDPDPFQVPMRFYRAQIASSEASDVDVQIFSRTFAKVTYDGNAAGSYGGAFLNFDLPNTPTVETFNFLTAFPAGLVFQLDGTLSQVDFELTDVNGLRSKVRLTGIQSYGQRYHILSSYFSGIDLTQIKTMTFVMLGDQDGYLNVDWGNWAYQPQIPPDPSQGVGDITKLPVNSLGTRVNLNALDDGEGASTAVILSSPTFGTATYTGVNAGSFGGAYVTYDDPDTIGTVETIDLTTLYPGGLVIGVESPALTEIEFQVKDADGKISRVTLTDLQNFGQRYLITLDQFFGVDLTKIKELAFIFHGTGTQVLKIDWGNFQYLGDISPDPTQGVDDITKLPVLGNGDRPSLNGFNKNDGTTSGVVMASPTFGTVNYVGVNATSFGGAYVSYDDPATAGVVETINLQALYPGGLVIGVESPDMTTVKFQVTDIDGNQSVVRLIDLENFGQRYLIGLDAFSGVDLTQIKELVFVIEGAGVKTLKIDWGTFVSKLVQPDPTKTVADVTKLPVRWDAQAVGIAGWASNDGSASVMDLASSTFGQMTYTGTGAGSMGGTYILYDNPATGGVVESVDLESLFPGGLIFGLGSPDLTQVDLEVKDATGAVDVVTLVGLAGTAQFYVVKWDALRNIDTSKITTLSFVVRGAGTKTLDIDWGNFNTAGILFPDPTKDTDDITKLPLTQSQVWPTLQGFASADGSTGAATLVTRTFGTIHYNGAGPNSYGGAFINYDNGASGGYESFNWTAAFPSGMVFGLESPDVTEAWLEIKDVDEHVVLLQIKDLKPYGQRYVVNASDLSGLDLAHIRVITILFKGAGAKTVKVDWGNFDFIPQIPADPTQGVDDITKLPVKSDGDRPSLNTFGEGSGAAVAVNMASPTFGTVTYTGANADAYGGAFISYDDPSTAGTVETINLQALYPGGLVIGVESPDMTQVKFQLTDIHGTRRYVMLTGLQNFGQRYTIPLDQFYDIDLTQIIELVFVIEGAGTKTLKIDWGNFASKVVSADPTKTTADVTKLPVRWDGQAVAIAGWANSGSAIAEIDHHSAASVTLNYVMAPSGSSQMGGAYILYDDPSTAAVTESVDLESLFPSGLIFGIGSADITEIRLELKDADGEADYVSLVGLSGTPQYYVVNWDSLRNIDASKITTISFVIFGTSAAVDIDWGNFNLNGKLLPDPTKDVDDITKLPLTMSNVWPPLQGFASLDGSTGTATLASRTFGTIAYTGTTADSYGGAFINYDNGASGTIESLNWSSAFPSGMVFGLESPDVTQAFLEIKDVNENVVLLEINDLKTYGQRYVVYASDLPGLDLTQIRVITFLLKGAGTKTLKVDWGNFDYQVQIPPDPTKGVDDITKLPVKSNGQAPSLNAFQEGVGGTTVGVDLASPTFGTVNYVGPSATSYGGAYISYDDFDTAGTVETIDLTAAFPGGLVIGVESPNMPQVKFQLTDIHGTQRYVMLTGLQNFGQRYTIPLDQFFGIDLTQIKELVFVIEGTGTKTLKVDWGTFQFLGDISPDPTQGVDDITKLPVLGNGDRPSLNGFNKNDGTTSGVVMASPTFGTVNYVGVNATSFGGAYVSYDDPATAGTVETINLQALYPGGLVIGVESPDMANVKFQVTDINGNQSVVRLIDLENFGQRYLIGLDAFSGVDLTQIKELVFVIEGAGAKTLKVDWGTFVSKLVQPDPTKTVADVTKLPVRWDAQAVGIGGWASADGSSSVMDLASSTFGRMTYTGTGAGSMGGTYILYDDPSTAGVVESVDLESLFPGGLIFGLGSPDMTQVDLEVKDATGAVDVVTLVGLAGTAQFYVVKWDALRNIDTSKITTLSFVVRGIGVRTLDIDWGNFNTSGILFPDPTMDTGDITKLPVLATGIRPVLQGFASADGSTGTAVLASSTFGTITYTGIGVNSYGGAYITYDDGGTAPVELLDWTAAFPGGMVFGLESPDVTGAWLEVKDGDDHVVLLEIKDLKTFGQRYVVEASDLAGLTLTEIKTITFLLKGTGTKTLKVDWGTFQFLGDISPDPTQGVDDITKLPVLGNGDRPSLNGFNKNDGTTSGVVMASPTFGTVNYVGVNATSFGGAYVSYDDPATAGTVETINLQALYPGGLVIGVESPDMANVKFQVTDINGNQSVVRLIDLENFGQRYLIGLDAFSGVDLTQIKELVFVIEGAGAKTLKVDWGTFVSKLVQPDPTKTVADVTKLPVRWDAQAVGIAGWASNDG
ncbi:MAG: hypothetical protein ACOY3K_06630, partial [Candidatus Omnitrophota bacterium]